jgi:hypothetical protein
MSRLTDNQVITIAHAAVLARQQAAVLSDFELELILEIGARFLQHGRQTVITPAEWLPFSDAVAAMAAAERRAADLDRSFSRAAVLANPRAA